MKKIVTHLGVDLDACCAVFLVKKFIPDFNQAEIVFVPAGKTYLNQKVDSNKDILHLDTGFGRFDHHQTQEKTCAAKLVYQYLEKEKLVVKKDLQALKRLTEQINQIDHFQQVFYEDPASDRYELFLEAILDGLTLMYPDQDLKIIEFCSELFEAIYHQFKDKIWAEELIKQKGFSFSSCWGKAMAVETTNDEVLKLSQKMGYRLVVRKDPRKGYVRIKSIPDDKIDLTKLYQKLKDEDPQATWFLHISRHMVLNGSSKNKEMKPTSLSLKQIINVIESILPAGQTSE